MNKKVFTILLVIFMAGLLIACPASQGPQEDGPPEPEPKPDGSAGGIKVTPETTCVVAGKQHQFTASVDGVTWSVKSDFPEGQVLGTVDSHGLFTAGGQTTMGLVRATKGEQSGSADVIVSTDDISCQLMAVSIDIGTITGGGQTTPEPGDENPPSDGDDFPDESIPPLDKCASGRWGAEVRWDMVSPIFEETGETGWEPRHIADANYREKMNIWFGCHKTDEKIELRGVGMGTQEIKGSDSCTVKNTLPGAEVFDVVMISGEYLDGKFVFTSGIMANPAFRVTAKEVLQIKCPGVSTTSPPVGTVPYLQIFQVAIMGARGIYPLSVPAIATGASVTFDGALPQTPEDHSVTIDGDITVWCREEDLDDKE